MATLERCDFRTYRECSCGPDQCRVQNLGTFTKSHDRKAKERQAQVSAIIAFQEAIAGLAFLGVVGLIFFTDTVPDGERQALRNQEITYHAN